jgi:Uma2 family endonuclease
VESYDMGTILAPPPVLLGPHSAGVSLAPREFDRAGFEEGWRYELIKGVLVVSPPPLEMERDPNEELGFLLRLYQLNHPQGHRIDKTLPEHTVRSRKNRRRADRVIWVGLGRLPTAKDVPAVIAEFVSKGKRGHRRDYVEKRNEYMAIKVQEYWIIDRFQRTLTVFTRRGKKVHKQVLGEKDTYTTPLLPGFELPLGRLLALADAWENVRERDGSWTEDE